MNRVKKYHCQETDKDKAGITIHRNENKTNISISQGIVNNQRKLAEGDGRPTAKTFAI